MVKHTQTIFRLLPKNVLNVFDHFLGLALKVLTHFTLMFHFYTPWKRQKTRGKELEHWHNIIWV